MADRLIPPAYAQTVQYRLVANVSGEAVPAFAVMKIAGIRPADGVLTVDKPDQDNLVNNLMANGPVPIPADSDGQGQFWPAVVGYDLSGPHPLAGAFWGVKAGSWFLNKHRSGFVVMTAGQADTGRLVLAGPMMQGYLQELYTEAVPGPEGSYEGVEKHFDPVLKTHADGQECYLAEPNGYVLQRGYYSGYYTGNAHGRRFYLVFANLPVLSGSGSGSGLGSGGPGTSLQVLIHVWCEGNVIKEQAATIVGDFTVIY